MSEIPEDVMEAARKQCDLCGVTIHSDMRVYAEHVAAFAILAERKRCADVARTFEDWGDCSGLLETSSIQIADKIEATPCA